MDGIFFSNSYKWEIGSLYSRPYDFYISKFMRANSWINLISKYKQWKIYSTGKSLMEKVKAWWNQWWFHGNGRKYSNVFVTLYLRRILDLDDEDIAQWPSNYFAPGERLSSASFEIAAERSPADNRKTIFSHECWCYRIYLRVCI